MIAWPDWLDASLRAEALTLVNRVRIFFYLQEMGMLNSDPIASKEANRRNTEIVSLRAKLGITKRQQALLVNLLNLQNHPFFPPNLCDLN